jgi:hypothetical protein
MHLFSGMSRHKKKPQLTHDWQYLGLQFNMHSIQYVRLEMEIYNKGRSPVDVTDAGFGLRGRNLHMATTSAKMQKALPARLEHGSKIAFEIDVVDLFENLDASELAGLEYFIAEVSLGNGTVVHSQNVPYEEWLTLLAEAEKDAVELSTRPSPGKAKIGDDAT